VGVLSVGVAATGLVSYAYFALASHALEPADYGRITLLWSAVFITVSILYRPIEQLLARTIADRDARRAPGAPHLRVAAQVELALATAFAALALALRRPIEDGLFDGSAALYWTMVATVLAYAGSYFARGVLAGTGRFRAYGGLLVLESCARVAFALAVAVGIASGASIVALGMAVAPAVSLAVVSALALRPGPAAAGTDDGAVPVPWTGAAEPAGSAAPEPEFTLVHGAGYAGAVLLVMASEQAFLNAGPLLVNATEATGGAALAGLVFNALLIARAPLQLFQAVQAAILPHLARLRARGRLDPFRRSVGVTLQAITVFAAVVVVGLLAVGPEAMDLLFGGEFDYDRGGLALMGVGMGLYLAGATLTQAALAAGQAGAAALRWLFALAAFIVVLVVPSIEDRVLQVEVAFATGALALFASLYPLYRRGEGEG
jgi:O-antigen/teichoic acid export membrane protein